MAIATKLLLAGTAADLMSTDLLLIHSTMSLPAAARLICQHNVSGAPVVDVSGHCVGVLSATDFMHWVQTSKLAGLKKPYEGCSCSSWQIEALEELPHDAVVYHMTADPVLVSETCTIAELAHMLLDAHIHRVIVVDAQNIPLGIVTATDVLAAVAYGGRESQQPVNEEKCTPCPLPHPVACAYRPTRRSTGQAIHMRSL